ncbi:hypothetical protein [Cyanobacterium aponinum]|uniref:Uncharacterized protein n=1 Tax=Cyanobacterium aponinum 0216 TaxID=2676140 RepID=A0A844GV13_9CHRO|nr:hypothetical protein [Cyanobacterium aponinum]MTF40304.1 hypothetical protein [Cyanobacterium aponinum 0216]
MGNLRKENWDKLGHPKTNNINSFKTELGQNNKFNFSSEYIEIQKNEDNVSTSVKKDGQENKNKIDSQENCPDNAPSCPKETLKPSHDNTLERPNFDKSVPISEKMIILFLQWRMKSQKRRKNGRGLKME